MEPMADILHINDRLVCLTDDLASFSSVAGVIRNDPRYLCDTNLLDILRQLVGQSLSMFSYAQYITSNKSSE